MRVLVAYDGGDAGERLLGAIAPWLRDTEAEVHMITVVHPKDIQDTARPHGSHALTPAGTTSGQLLSVSEPLTELAEDRTQALAATRITTEERLYEVAGGYVPKASVVVHAELAEDTAGAIARAATRLDVDVIAIGTHGRTGMSHVLMGSVAEAVVRNATVPVLVVGPKVKVVPPA